MTVECVICLQTANSQLQLQCRHSFCKDCIERWLGINNCCPVCKEQVGSKQNNNLKQSGEEVEPCIDHLYPQRNTLRQKLEYLANRIQTKRSASIKGSLPKTVLRDMSQRLNELWDMFDIFSCMIDEVQGISGAVVIMETIGLGIFELENIVDGKVSTTSIETFQQFEYDEDDFPELVVHEKKKKVKTTKRHTVK